MHIEVSMVNFFLNGSDFVVCPLSFIIIFGIPHPLSPFLTKGFEIYYSLYFVCQVFVSQLQR